ncbi:MAG: heme o synthase [Acidimicrobiales bacterium]
MVYDRDIDAMMSRTRERPIVTGDVSPGSALVFALCLEAGAFALLYGEVNLLAAGLTLGAAAFYVGVYTVVLKRRTRHNVVIGGAAGAAPVLVAWAAVTGHLAPAPWLLFALIFLWTPPHFWALAVRYKDDYDKAGVPMLPAVADLRTVANQILTYSVLLGAVSLTLVPVARLGPLFGVVAAGLGAAFAVMAWRLRSDPSSRRALQVFHYSISYLTAMFVAVAVLVLLGRP